MDTHTHIHNLSLTHTHSLSLSHTHTRTQKLPRNVEGWLYYEGTHDQSLQEQTKYLHKSNKKNRQNHQQPKTLNSWKKHPPQELRLQAVKTVISSQCIPPTRDPTSEEEFDSAKCTSQTQSDSTSLVKQTATKNCKNSFRLGWYISFLPIWYLSFLPILLPLFLILWGAPATFEELEAITVAAWDAV